MKESEKRAEVHKSKFKEVYALLIERQALIEDYLENQSAYDEGDLEQRVDPGNFYVFIYAHN